MASDNKKCILIIEDDEVALITLKEILEHAGYKVEKASSITEARNIINEKLPHLVIVDLLLNRESGFAYIDQHKKSKFLKHVPMIVSSGVDDKNMIIHAISLGIADYIVKPIKAATLIKKVAKILKESAFPVVSFEKKSAPKATLISKGAVMMLNDIEIGIEVPLKIKENTQIKGNGTLFEQIASEKCVLKRSKETPKTVENGNHLNKLTLVAMSESGLKAVRKIMESYE